MEEYTINCTIETQIDEVIVAASEDEAIEAFKAIVEGYTLNTSDIVDIEISQQ